MWRVYLREDSWECGFDMPTEDECIKYCEENQGYTYSYKQYY